MGADKYRMQRRLGFLVLALLLTWLIGTFLIMPNLNLLKVTLFPNGAVDVKPLAQIFKSERVRKALVHSFILAVSLTVTVNALGIFEILVLEYFDIRGSKWLNIAYHSPLICNGMVLVTAYNFILGSQGFITARLMNLYPDFNPYWFRGFWAVLLEMTFAGTTNHIMFVRDSLKNVDYQTIEAARNMGVKSHRILSRIVLPTLKPSVFAASILTFITGMSAFATPQVLGGENFETLNPLVMSFSRTLTTRNYAAILAIFLGMVSITVLLISNYIESKGNYVSVSKVKTPLKRMKIQNPYVNGAVTVFAHVTALVQTLPLLFVALFSFMSIQDLYSGTIRISNFSLRNYMLVFRSSSGLRPILTSLVYAGFAAVIVVAMMLFIGRILTKYHNRLTACLEVVLQIPWFLPATLIALGLIMVFDRPSVLTFGATLTGSIYIMLIGYVINKTPYTLRMIKAAYMGLDHSLEEAAKNLGASALKTYVKILLPIIWPTILSVFLLNVIGLLAEYNMSVFLFHPMYQPLGVVLNAATKTDALPEAQMLTFVYSVLIMAISTVIIVFVYGKKNKALKHRL